MTGLSTRPLKIVLVNDETSINEILDLAIRCTFPNVAVSLFEDAEAALAQLSRQAPDLLITDILMPHMDGFQLCERLLENEATYPIVVLDTFGDSWVRDRVRDLAVRGFNVSALSWPWDVESILSAVGGALKIQPALLLQNRDKPSKRPLRIVSVDDDDLRLEMVEMAVSSFFKDVAVQSFRDPEEAWQELSRADPDLLITDDIMGNLNGDEIVRRLAHRRAAYPIIVIQGYPERDQWVLDCAERGGDVTLLRAPYDLEGLVRALERGLKIRRDYGQMAEGVANTPAFVEREKTTEAVISVAMCGLEGPLFKEVVISMLQQGLSSPSRVECKSFVWTNDFLEAARSSQFELFILLLNPGCSSIKHEIDAYDFIADLKREFNRPIIAVSNGCKYGSKADLERAGADAVLWMPFGIDEFRAELNRCLPGLSQNSKRV